VLVFARSPQKGRVKTRLAAKLGADAALALYMAFSEDLLETLAALKLHRIVCYHPARDRSQMRAWLGATVELVPQGGLHLGHRMAGALEEAFRQGYHTALLVGTDLPDLPAAVFQEALQALTSHGAVIGPARDGGYYLIGFRRQAFRPSIFEGIDWGSAKVLRQTMTRWEQSATTVTIHRLPPWSDIDTLDDLMDLAGRLKERPRACPKTRQWLRRLGYLQGED
jgi:rSAM/selenodomain-associated transferase 1